MFHLIINRNQLQCGDEWKLWPSLIGATATSAFINVNCSQKYSLFPFNDFSSKRCALIDPFSLQMFWIVPPVSRKVLQRTWMMALQLSMVPVTIRQHTQCQDPETEAAIKKDPDIIMLLFTSVFPAVTWHKVFLKKKQKQKPSSVTNIFCQFSWSSKL